VIGGLPVVALVGRPNVGKSALFNRLVGARRAIVDDVPGVTRDRLVAAASHAERRFLCVDTGGFHADEGRGDGAMSARVRHAALQAVGDADVLVCVVDGQAGLLPEDTALVRLLARTGKPVVLAVNKIDVASQDVLPLEFHRTGVEAIVATSAAHNRGIGSLLDAVAVRLPPAPPAPPAAEGLTRVALVGRPNVGKSSLLNRLAGSERSLVSEEPGTTRDVVDTMVEVGGRSYVFVDTAGIRRQGRVTDPLERHGAVRALAALERADVVLLVLDAVQGVTDQDARLTGRVLDAGRGIILVANKSDLAGGSTRAVAAVRDAIARAHPGLGTLPIVPVSAATGDGLDHVIATLRRVERCYDRVLQTATLNRALQAATAAHAPAAVRGRAVRLFYATQTGRRPPEITVFASDPTALGAAYRRYLVNHLTQTFAMTGVPVRLVCRRRHPPRPVSRGPGSGNAARGPRSGRPKPPGRRSRRP
jgi:GTP-binding protein